MFISELDGAEMPMWCPPTPPQDDNDIYMDETLCFLYEPRVMPEQALPPVYVPKAHKKPKLEAITTRKQKQRKEEQPRVPRSLFDKPKEVVMKQRRDAKMQRLRHNFQVPTKMIAGRAPLGQQPSQPTTPQPTPIVAKPEPDPNYPEWLVHEEWALLEAVQNIQKLNSDLLIDNPAQIVNWDFVSDFVSVVGRCFRAAKHCRYQYEYVVLPREDGKIVYNMKQKKSPKSIYKTKNSRPLRTEQLYSQEGLRNFSQLYDIRFTAMMDIGSKRPAALRQTIVNPAAKPIKHALILAEQGINYDQPQLPSQLAARRAERIALDKKKQQQAAAAQQQQQQQAAAVAAAQQAQAASVTAAVQDVSALAQRTVQAGFATPGVTPTLQGQQLSSIVSVTPTTVITGQVPKVAVGAGLSAVSIARTLGAAAGNIIVNAPAGLQSGPFAAINKRISQAALPNTIPVSANLTPTIRGQRPSTPTITMQDLATSTAITLASVAGARPLIQTTVAASSLAAGQKIAAMTATGGLQPQLTARSLTPHQINILRQSQQSIIRTQAAGAGGTAHLRAQRLLTPDQLRAQQLKHTTQKVITQQLLVPVRGGQSILQGAKPAGLLRATALPRVGEEQLQALRMRTQMQAQAGKQLQTAQIIQGQVTPGVATSQTPVALVKSVTASPAVTVTGTIPVTGLAVAQQRTVVASKSPTVSQLQQQRMLLQQRKVGGQPKVTGLAAGKAGQQIPLLIPQNTRLNTVLTSNQILHQIGLVNKTSGAIQQIITHSSQPTIITQVTQAGGQPITQMKVSLTSGNQTLTAGTPITVTQVTSAGGAGIGLSLSGPGPVKTATITSLEAGSTPTGIQVHAVAGQTAGVAKQQSLVTAQAVAAGQQQQSLVTAQAIQIQQAGTSTPTSGQSTLAAASPVQFLQVTNASGQSGSQAAGVTSVLRAVSVVSRAQTPTQISLVPSTQAQPSSAASQPVTVAAVSTQSVQLAVAGTTESGAGAQTHVIAQNVPAPAAMATVVTQTNQPEATQSTAGSQKASPYAMRTRNTKH
ncbi:E1A-binding protein p400 [Elysia marginata]|uniref:E1A-binding protein p400 n=1 Tax=Elysia marginata TaxID=1093978 RepID=A0AAV4GYC0_9GAST|nr:E1A-binding protein p400 [Elysia marginata]